MCSGWVIGAAVWPKHRRGEAGFLYFVTAAELACFHDFCRHLLTNPVRYTNLEINRWINKIPHKKYWLCKERVQIDTSVESSPAHGAEDSNGRQCHFPEWSLWPGDNLPLLDWNLGCKVSDQTSCNIFFYTMNCMVFSLFSTKLKAAYRPWNLPQALFIEKMEPWIR